MMKSKVSNARIDVNVSFGHWPVRRFPLDSLSKLSAALRAENVSEAWIAAVDSVLFPDPDITDEELFGGLRRLPVFRPVKTVNPTIPGWRDSLKDFRRRWDLAAIRLYPNYHLYSVADAEAGHVFEYAAESRLPVMIVMRLEDERQHHPLMQVTGVPFNEITGAAGRHPETNFIALNTYFREAVTLPPKITNLYFDPAFVEAPASLDSLLEHVDSKQLLYGSHAPFFTMRAAAAKLESSRAKQSVKRRIAFTNARKLAARRR